jgi:glycosyltransferase involved in cell wall biosynthesis
MNAKDINIPKVSVCIFAYNLEKYIGKAIESALMQKTNFPFEIIIGEDCSTDNTKKICMDYERNNSIIKVLRREKNLGMSRNVFDTLKEAQGEFVAILDADDYWIDPLKLQKQVEFMAANPKCSLCCHNSIVLHEDHDISPYLFNPRSQKELISFEDIIMKWPMATASMLFRSSMITFPEWVYQAHNFDLAIQVVLADKGEVRYLPEPMSVYRKTLLSNSFNPAYPQDYVYFRLIELLKLINSYYDFKYDYIIREKISALEKIIKKIRLNSKFPLLNYLRIKRLFRYLGR